MYPSERKYGLWSARSEICCGYSWAVRLNASVFVFSFVLYCRCLNGHMPAFSGTSQRGTRPIIRPRGGFIAYGGEGFIGYGGDASALKTAAHAQSTVRA
jgi:hypothetical protein